MVNIRRFTMEGSTTTPTVLEEAQRVAAEHLHKGGLVIDEDIHEMIQEILPTTGNILLVDPIIGG